LRGAFALGFIFAGEDDLMIGAATARRCDRHGDGEMVSRLGRVALGRSPTRSAYLEDGDWWC